MMFYLTMVSTITIEFNTIPMSNLTMVTTLTKGPHPQRWTNGYYLVGRGPDVVADVGPPVGAVPAAVGPEDDDGLGLDVPLVEETPQLVLGPARRLQAPLRVEVVLPEDEAVSLVLGGFWNHVLIM